MFQSPPLTLARSFFDKVPSLRAQSFLGSGLLQQRSARTTATNPNTAHHKQTPVHSSSVLPSHRASLLSPDHLQSQRTTSPKPKLCNLRRTEQTAVLPGLRQSRPENTVEPERVAFEVGPTNTAQLCQGQ